MRGHPFARWGRRAVAHAPSWIGVLACAVALVSTVCYVTEVRSRYTALYEDYDALAAAMDGGAGLGALAAAPQAVPRLTFGGVTMHTVVDAWLLSTSSLRPRSRAVATRYALRQFVCAWRPAVEPAAGITAAAAGPDAAPLLLVFFVHGNAGGCTQGRYWSCAVQHAGAARGVHTRAFSVDLVEQANVHRGGLVATQAEYMADAIEHVVAQVRGATPTPQVWLVSHSMGSLVARLAVQLLDASVRVGGLIAFNAPLRFPPLLLDAPMAHVYTALAAAERLPADDDDDHNCATQSAASASAHRTNTAVLLQRCASGVCVPPRACSRRRPRLLSMTSGEMDLQIEPAATRPLQQGRSVYTATHMNTLDDEVCGRSTSHDGVLVDPCAMARTAALLVNATLHAGMGSEAGAALTAHDPKPPSLSPAVPWQARAGQLLWQRHVWPCAVAALYTHVLLAGLYPHLREAGASQEAAPTQRRRPLQLFWCTSVRLPVAATVFFFYDCVALYAVWTVVFNLLAGTREAHQAQKPWQWATFPQLHAATAAAFVAQSAVFVATSLGPVVFGALVGDAAVRAAEMLPRVLGRVRWCGWGSAGGVAFWPLPRQRWRCGTPLTLPLPVLISILLWLAGASLTARALVWLALSLTARAPPQHREEDGESSAEVAGTAEEPAALKPLRSDAVYVPADVTRHAARGNRLLPAVLHAALYALQLHPFFALRNALISRTADDAVTVDWRTYAAEAATVTLMLAATARISVTVPSWGRRRAARLGSLVRRVCLAAALLSVAAVSSHPPESFRVLPALLLCWPLYLHTAASLP